MKQKILAHIDRIVPEPFRTELRQAVCAEFAQVEDVSRREATTKLNRFLASTGELERVVRKNS